MMVETQQVRSLEKESSAVFQNRFANKKKFDYAEFNGKGKADIEKDGSIAAAVCDAAISPLSLDHQ